MKPGHPINCSSSRNRRTSSNRRRLRLSLERLEGRLLLAGDPWSWFQSFDDVQRIAPGDLSAETRIEPTRIGPHDLVASEWIVQLSGAARSSISGLDSINDLLNRNPVDFTVISGLGSEGLVLLRGRGVTTDDVRVALESNRSVEHVSANSLIQGQTLSNDPELQGGGLFGLEEINTPAAWDVTQGSSSVVVGVLDGGIDATHADLFLNIWLNQGEIPVAIRGQLSDIDQDGLITFYDLNNLRVTAAGIEVASTPGVLAETAELIGTPFESGANKDLVSDFNLNGRIDVMDLLADDARWADGRDTDQNGFFDDLFGVNFRAGGSEGLARNEPFDELGHGTHVAGTIGAIGNNGFGVVGVNWRTSLMSLRILDNANQSDAAAAITAVNYATAMRAQMSTDENGQVRSGANVRVLNNSWGQPGGFDQALSSAIEQSNAQEILFVAAAGNGSAVSLQGINNDRTPFYPASYESDNVLAVAALGSSGDQLAALSNFGRESVDIAAPGVTIRSTRPGGGFEAESGTSMATPHVAGAAALIWAAQPSATVDEVVRAITETAVPFSDGEKLLTTGGTLDVNAAINADVFAPAAQLVERNDVRSSGGTTTEFTVQYSHRSGIDVATIATGDVQVTRQWGPRSEIIPTLKPGSVEEIDPETVRATYVVAAPDGTWDPLDFGDYRISVLENAVSSDSNVIPMRAADLGSFDVLIRDEGFFYVSTTADGADSDILDGVASDAGGAVTLRAAVQQANQNSLSDPGTQSSIILLPGEYELTIAGANEDFAATGDLDIVGNIRIFGDMRETTRIASRVNDRLLHSLSSGLLELSRISLSDGRVAGDGGAILVAGTLVATEVGIFDSVASSGGAIAVSAGGELTLTDNSTIEGNESTFIESLEDAQGGAIFLDSNSSASISQTTIAQNGGGGVNQMQSSFVALSNTTVSNNSLTGIKLFGAASLDHVTIADNAQFGLAFGIEDLIDIPLPIESVATRVRVKNTLIEGNTLGAYPFLFPSENVSISDGSNVVQATGSEIQLTTDELLNFDVNDSGDITSADALLVLNNIDPDTLQGDPEIGGDVNGDGRVTFLDALIILNEGRKKSGFNDTPIFDQPSDVFTSATTRTLLPLGFYGSRNRHHPLRPASIPIDAGTGDSLEDQLGQARDTPDVGAIEFNAGDLRATGKVFDDRNQDGIQNAGERGVSNQLVFLDIDQDGTLDLFESSVRTSSDNPLTANVDEAGDFMLFSSSTSDALVTIVPDTDWVISEPPIQRLSETSENVGGDGNSGVSIPPFATEEVVVRPPTISSSGRFISYTSQADNLDGTFIDRGLDRVEEHGFTASKVLLSDLGDRFYFDNGSATNSNSTYRLVRANGAVETVGDFGLQLNEGDAIWEGFAITPGGDVRAFLTAESSIFVNVQTDSSLEKFDVGSDIGANNGRPRFSISGDGKVVAFTDYPSPHSIIRTIQTQTGVFSTPTPTPNGASAFPSLNGDGSVLVFQSDASNLVSDDNNDSTDIFRLQDGVIERISLANGNREADGDSIRPTITADGEYIVFSSDARLSEADTNFLSDIYVYSADRNEVRLVSIGDNGIASNGLSFVPTISADGRYIVFSSFANNLIDSDINEFADIFLATNPFLGVLEEAFGKTASVVGTATQTVNFAVVGRPGRIAGNLFHDIVENGVKDLGEVGIPGGLVYVDLNRNGSRDPNEPFTVSDELGGYSFEDFPANESYRLVVQSPSGFELGAIDTTAVDFFLPADGNISGRDFPFVRVTGSGQSTSDSSVSGRVYRDLNGSGDFDAGDIPLANTVVFLDVNNIGTKDSNEPRSVTDSQGRYTISDLPAIQGAVTAETDETNVNISPLGNDFDPTRFPLFDSPKRFQFPYAVTSALLDDDLFPDVALTHFDSNAISIRINDGLGGLLSDELEFDLGNDGGQPTSIVAGQFNGEGTGTDIAVTNYSTGNVIVLYDFDGTAFDANKTAVIAVGDQPLDIISAAITGDSHHLDLIVVNQRDRTIQLLSNRGDNGFLAETAISTGGVDPVSLVAGQFTADPALDIAVVHTSSAGDATRGDVRVLEGNGNGGFDLLAGVFPVGATPIDLIVSDFDNDPAGRLDLAVANSNSNSIWILTGRGDGTFDVHDADGEILGAPNGVTDIVAADIDGDDDVDIISGNPQFGDISVFRNNSTAGSIEFQPLEGIGAGSFSVAQRLPIALDNFDQDTSGTNGKGTIDLLSVQPFNALTLTTTLEIRLNTLIDGAHRVSLTGLNAKTNLDFMVEPATLLPAFDAIRDPSPIVEDAGLQTIVLTGIAKGRAGGPPLEFAATSSSPGSIPDPTIVHIGGESTATLSYTPVANAFDPATITVTVTDAGADQIIGTNDDAIITDEFFVNILPVNDAPTFTIPASLNVFEDSAAQSIPNFATGITPGAGETQTLSDFSVAADSSFFTVPPVIDRSGQLTFTTEADVSGSVTVNVSLSDDGGSANGGINRTNQAFVINITAVNDAPSITIGGDQTVQENSGIQTVDLFATEFDPGGGADEASQVINDFIVTNNDNRLFAIQPQIDTNGTLTYTPAAVANGSATVTVRVRDSGGVETSAAQTFVITVTSTPDTTAPSPVIASNQPDVTNQSSFNITVDFGETVTGFAASDITISGAIAGTPTDQGNGLFTVPITASADGTVTVAVGPATVSDSAGNANVTSNSISLSVDSTALVPTLTTAQSSPTTSNSFNVSIDFGETVTGLLASDLTVINGTVSDLVDSGVGAFTATITADGDGSVTVVVPNAAAQDTAGNDSLVSAQLRVTIDTTAPAPALSVLDSSPANQSTMNVEVDFGESVTGFDANDLVLSSGSVDNISDRGNGRFLATLSGLSEGAFTLSLGADSAADLAGNPSTAATDLNQTITLPNAESIILEGSGNTFFLTQSNSQLNGVQLIDIRGSGDNTLMLDVNRIRDAFAGGAIQVLSDAGDSIVFDEGWAFVEAAVANGQLLRRFEQAGALISLIGPDDFTNPISEFDANAQGGVTSLDALVIINELGRRRFSDGNSNPVGAVLGAGEINLSDFLFYDVTRDLRITALDALRVINQLARLQATASSSEGEAVVGLPVDSRISGGREFHSDEPLSSIDVASSDQAILQFAIDEPLRPTEVDLRATATSESTMSKLDVLQIDLAIQTLQDESSI